MGLGPHLRRAGERLCNVLAPRSCGFCGALLAAGAVCAGCREDLPVIACPCRRCAAPLASTANQVCGRCLRRPPAFDRAFVPFRYAFPIEAAVKALKFRRQLFLAPTLAEVAHRHTREAIVDYEVLLPVPLHWSRRLQRGFNQANELALWLSRTSRLPIIHAARRVRRTAPQSALRGAARRRNVRDAFAVTRQLDGAKVLLIDDVLTTGETCEELARLLKTTGASQVGVWAVARGVRA